MSHHGEPLPDAKNGISSEEEGTGMENLKEREDIEFTVGDDDSPIVETKACLGWDRLKRLTFEGEM